MKKLFLIFALVIFTFNLSFSQTRAERKQVKKERIEAQFKETRALIESGSFQFEARWANPLGNDVVNIGQRLSGGAAVFQGNRINLVGNPSFVKITNNEVDIFLPFFGRVFFPKRINNERGIVYKGIVRDYSLSVNDKKKVFTIKFNAKSKDDYLKFIMRINAAGNAVLNVNTTNRQTISYDGEISSLEEKETN